MLSWKGLYAILLCQLPPCAYVPPCGPMAVVQPVFVLNLELFVGCWQCKPSGCPPVTAPPCMHCSFLLYNLHVAQLSLQLNAPVLP